ncbi:MAG: PD-(D/E)XK nuclease family protein, partial [Pseudomonadota bacterium]
RSDEEYRRLLYVAMTRAADRLYVCGWETSRKPAEGCWYNLIAGALADLAEPVDIDFGAGWAGRGWRLETGQLGRTAALPPDTRAEAAPPLPAWATRPPPPEPDPPAPLAPSRSGEEEPPVRSPLDGDDGAYFRRGRLIHRLLQTLPDVDPASREAAARRFLAQPVHELPAAAVDDMVGETLAVLDHPDFAPLFGPGSLAEAPVSGIVAGPDGTARVLSGQVDRLLVADDYVIIVDYKTNRPPPPTEAEVPGIYLRQMAAYRTVLKQIYPDREVRCAIIWTDGPRLMELVPETLDSYAPS